MAHLSEADDVWMQQLSVVDNLALCVLVEARALYTRDKLGRHQLLRLLVLHQLHGGALLGSQLPLDGVTILAILLIGLSLRLARCSWACWPALLLLLLCPAVWSAHYFLIAVRPLETGGICTHAGSSGLQISAKAGRAGV